MASQNNEEEADAGLQLQLRERKVPWPSGIMTCFSNFFKTLGRPLLRRRNGSNWEIPMDSIRQLGFLGSGAQGVVFKGLWRGEIVAVKKMRGPGENDVKHLRNLNHPNIVRFLGACNDSPYYCVVMEYCQYGALFDYLRSGVVLQPSQIMTWAKNICLAMAYLHSSNIIHRDLKSPNVLITDDLTVKVSDFGTSRVWKNVSTIMSFTGTACWMAPEVIRHERCSEKVDVWSFGVVLWELITREIPYRTLDSHAVMWGVGTDSLALPIPIGCPNTIQIAMCHCWQRIPRNRPSFTDLAAYMDMATPDIAATDLQAFAAKQKDWGEEVREKMEMIYFKSERDWQHAKRAPPREVVERVHEVYDEQINRSNELFMELCSLRLQLETRESAIIEREKRLNACHCGKRKPFLKRLVSSTSSFLAAVTTQQPRRQRPPTELYVNFDDSKKSKKISTVALRRCFFRKDSVDNNNVSPKRQPAPVEKKDTVIELYEENGNVEGDLVDCLIPSLANAPIPDVAQV